MTSPRPLPTGRACSTRCCRGPRRWPPAGALTRVRIDVRFARRGRKVLAPPRVAVRDPFGLLTRVVRGLQVDARRGPRPAAHRAGPRARRRRRQTGSLLVGRRSSVAAEVELDGLRHAREGTSASRIYWPSLAKGGELLERRLRADSDTRPLVVLDPRGAAVEEDLDAAVRAAASLAVHLAREGGCALLIPGDRRPASLDPALLGWPHLHARLALIDGDGAARAVGRRRAPRADRLRRRAPADPPAARAGPRARRRPPARRARRDRRPAGVVHRRRLHGLRALRGPPARREAAA